MSAEWLSQSKPTEHRGRGNVRRRGVIGAPRGTLVTPTLRQAHEGGDANQAFSLQIGRKPESPKPSVGLEPTPHSCAMDVLYQLR